MNLFGTYKELSFAAELYTTIIFCHWDLNSIIAHGYAKVSLLKAYITARKMNIICLSETYFDSSIQPDNDNLEIPGYSLVRYDHPSNNKRGGVCIYYKASLPLRVINICFLQECINFKVMIVTNNVTLLLSTGHPVRTKMNLILFQKTLK